MKKQTAPSQLNGPRRRSFLLRRFTLGLLTAFAAGFTTVGWMKSQTGEGSAVTPSGSQLAYSLAVPAMPKPAASQPVQQMVFDYRGAGHAVSDNPRRMQEGQVAVLVPALMPAIVPQAAPATAAEMSALQDIQPAAGPAVVPASALRIAAPERVEAPPSRSGQPRVAIVIDDIGPNYRESLAAISTLPKEITLAFLPYAEQLDTLTRRARAAGHEMIVHMPMEPENMKGNNPGPEALTLDLEPEQIRARVVAALERMNGEIGLNNHMGSRFTASVAGMQIVAEELAKRDLLFLDSRTTPQSVGIEVATANNLRFAGRDVFLDNEAEVDLIEIQLRTLERLARVQGHAIAIGHPYPQTLAALKAWLPGARERGVEIVPLSALAKRLGMSRVSTGQ